jgi:hypothetical protein
MEDLWELVSERSVRVTRPESGYVVESSDELRIDSSTWNGADVFRSKDVLYTFFTERGREWFLENLEEYACFKAFESTE